MGSLVHDAPYAEVLAAIERELHPGPSPGFRGRALFLEALTAAYVALALFYLASLIVRARRDGTSLPPLFRRIPLRAGSLLALDTSILLPCTTIAVGLLSLGNISILSTEAGEHAGIATQFGLRAIRGLLLFLQGWCMIWGTLQAFWAAGPPDLVRVPVAHATNLLFIGLGLCGAIAGLATGLSTMVACHRVSVSFAWIRSTLAKLEQSTPTPTVAAMIRISPGVDALRNAATGLRVTMLGTFGVMCAMALSVLAVCIYSLYALATPEPSAPPIQLPISPPGICTPVQKCEFIEDLGDVENGSLVDWAEKRFEKAKDDLAVTSLTVGLLAIVLACSLGFSISLATKNRLFGASSFASELAHLVFAYFYALVQLSTLTLLLHHVLAPSAPELPPSPGTSATPRRSRTAPSSRVLRWSRVLRTPNASFPTPSQLVDKVPLIRNPGFWVPKPVELPPDIHPLPEDVHAYFVYPHTLEAHVLSTLPSALQTLQLAHTQRQALLASYAESKERARKARLNQVAPGYAEGGAALEPVRRDVAHPSTSARSQASQVQRMDLMGGGSDDEAAPAELEGSVLGKPRAASPGEMGGATIDQVQRDQLVDVFDGLDRLDATLGGGRGTSTGGGGDVADLI
ncbi:hypothetical protein JCM3770_001445 [Rhodotorula araucariae]